MRRLWCLDIQHGIMVKTILFCHLFFVGIINSLGTLAAAAHSLGVRIESLAYLPGTAFQIAAATMAGQYLGARDHNRAMRGVLTACLTGGAVMISAGVVMFVGAESLSAFFTGCGTSATAVIRCHHQ